MNSHFTVNLMHCNVIQEENNWMMPCLTSQVQQQGLKCYGFWEI